MAAGLRLASVPLGDQPAHDYETLTDLLVDAALNDIELFGATRPARLPAGADRFRLKGIGHRIEPGDPVALVGPHWQGFEVTGVTELLAEDAIRSSSIWGWPNQSIRRPPRARTRPCCSPIPSGPSGPSVRAPDAVAYPPGAIRNAGPRPLSLPAPTATPF